MPELPDRSQWRPGARMPAFDEWLTWFYSRPREQHLARMAELFPDVDPAQAGQHYDKFVSALIDPFGYGCQPPGSTR